MDVNTGLYRMPPKAKPRAARNAPYRLAVTTIEQIAIEAARWHITPTELVRTAIDRELERLHGLNSPWEE